MDRTFGGLVREKRLQKANVDPAYSLRRMADRIGIEPSYLSKIERGQEQPPGEETIRRIARDLGENPDAMLALAGKVSSELIDIIRARPVAVAELLRSVRRAPAKRVAEITRQIREGTW